MSSKKPTKTTQDPKVSTATERPSAKTTSPTTQGLASLVTSSVVPQRSAVQITPAREETASAVPDAAVVNINPPDLEWSDYMQRFAIYFATRGELKEVEVEGKQVAVYVWHGVTSTGKRVIVQLWRQNAPVFAKFVETNQDEDEGQLWLFKHPDCFPPIQQTFRIKQPTDYQKKEFHADYALSLSVGEGEKHNYKTAKFTFDTFPEVIGWDDSAVVYQTYTEEGQTTIERVIEPSQWCTKVFDGVTTIPFKTLSTPLKKRSMFDILADESTNKGPRAFAEGFDMYTAGCGNTPIKSARY